MFLQICDDVFGDGVKVAVVIVLSRYVGWCWLVREMVWSAWGALVLGVEGESGVFFECGVAAS